MCVCVWGGGGEGGKGAGGEGGGTRVCVPWSFHVLAAAKVYFLETDPLRQVYVLPH